jgi:aspartate kinase
LIKSNLFMIKVLKFGGASIKDIESINNVLKILQTYREDNIVVVFSAIGKVTNMLEKLIDLYVSKSPLVSQQLNKKVF